MQTDDNRSKGGFGDNPQNINRNGRPPKGQTLTDLMKDHLYNIDEDSKMDNKQIFIEKVFKMAKGGDMNAIRLIWNYIDGMPRQKIEHEGNYISGVKVQIVNDRTELESNQRLSEELPEQQEDNS